MEILNATIVSVTVSEIKQIDDYFGEYSWLAVKIEIIDKHNKTHSCRFMNLGLDEKNINKGYPDNSKVKAKQELFEKKLNSYFSVNNEITVIGNIEKAFVVGNEVFMIHAFYNKTKDIIKLKSYAPTHVFFIWIIMSFSLIKVSEIEFKYQIGGYIGCFLGYFIVHILKVRKINSPLLKIRQSIKKNPLN